MPGKACWSRRPHLVALLGPGAGEDPAAARRAAVVAQGQSPATARRPWPGSCRWPGRPGRSGACTVELPGQFVRARFVGLEGQDPSRGRGSGRGPRRPRRYISRRRWNSPAMMAMSGRAWPGGSAPFQCHCNQRPLLTIETVFLGEAGGVGGNTVVLMLAVSTSLYSPTLRQNSGLGSPAGPSPPSTSGAPARRPAGLVGEQAMGLKPWQK